MNITKKIILQLQDRLKLVAETNTADGITLRVVGKFEVGEEIFVVNEDNDLEPAPDGVYETSEYTIEAQGGIIVGIASKEAEPIAEEQPEELEIEPEATEEPTTDNTEELEAIKAERDQLKNQVEELLKECADREENYNALKAEYDKVKAELEALKEEPTEAPIHESKFAEEKSVSVRERIEAIRKTK